MSMQFRRIALAQGIPAGMMLPTWGTDAGGYQVPAAVGRVGSVDSAAPARLGDAVTDEDCGRSLPVRG